MHELLYSPYCMYHSSGAYIALSYGYWAKALHRSGLHTVHWTVTGQQPLGAVLPAPCFLSDSTTVLYPQESLAVAGIVFGCLVGGVGTTGFRHRGTGPRKTLGGLPSEGGVRFRHVQC